MKHLIQWAARLYPRAWRKRYGEEFAALLEDTGPQARDTWDIAKEALSMQIQRTAALAVIGTMLGGLAGGLISLYRALLAAPVPWSCCPCGSIGALLAGCGSADDR
jgi:hypothetical protein